jgi:hypothetical protein
MPRGWADVGAVGEPFDEPPDEAVFERASVPCAEQQRLRPVEPERAAVREPFGEGGESGREGDGASAGAGLRAPHPRPLSSSSARVRLVASLTRMPVGRSSATVNRSGRLPGEASRALVFGRAEPVILGLSGAGAVSATGPGTRPGGRPLQLSVSALALPTVYRRGNAKIWLNQAVSAARMEGSKVMAEALR